MEGDTVAQLFQTPDIMAREPVGDQAMAVGGTAIMVRRVIPQDVIRGHRDAVPGGQRRLLPPATVQTRVLVDASNSSVAYSLVLLALLRYSSSR